MFETDLTALFDLLADKAAAYGGVIYLINLAAKFVNKRYLVGKEGKVAKFLSKVLDLIGFYIPTKIKGQ